MSICYDVRFPELYPRSPCRGDEFPVRAGRVPVVETGVDHWEPLLRARAIESPRRSSSPRRSGGPGRAGSAGTTVTAWSPTRGDDDAEAPEGVRGDLRQPTGTGRARPGGFLPSLSHRRLQPFLSTPNPLTAFPLSLSGRAQPFRTMVRCPARSHSGYASGSRPSVGLSFGPLAPIHPSKGWSRQGQTAGNGGTQSSGPHRSQGRGRPSCRRTGLHPSPEPAGTLTSRRRHSSRSAGTGARWRSCSCSRPSSCRRDRQIAPAHAGTGLRSQMVQLTNDDRTDKDRSALELDLQLSRGLRQEALAGHGGRGGISRTDELAAKLKGKDWSAGGENVGIIEPPAPRSRLHGFDAAPPEHPEQGVRSHRDRRRRVRRELLGDRHLLRLALPT